MRVRRVSGQKLETLSQRPEGNGPQLSSHSGRFVLTTAWLLEGIPINAAPSAKSLPRPQLRKLVSTTTSSRQRLGTQKKIKNGFTPAGRAGSSALGNLYVNSGDCSSPACPASHHPIIVVSSHRTQMGFRLPAGNCMMRGFCWGGAEEGDPGCFPQSQSIRWSSCSRSPA